MNRKWMVTGWIGALALSVVILGCPKKAPEPVAPAPPPPPAPVREVVPPPQPEPPPDVTPDPDSESLILDLVQDQEVFIRARVGASVEDGRLVSYRLSIEKYVP